MIEVRRSSWEVLLKGQSSMSLLPLSICQGTLGILLYRYPCAAWLDAPYRDNDKGLRVC